MKKIYFKNILSKIILGGAVIGSLSACVPVMMAGGAVGGTMAAVDRRTIGSQTEDKVIQLKGENVAYKLSGDNGHVNVTCFNRKVLLTGEVPSEAIRQAVNNGIAQIENVQSIANQLVIAPATGITSRSNDTLITGKVASTFLDDKQTVSSAFKTVTERGIVYLMGRVTKAEGDHAAKLASTVSGVQQVVKVFDYITPEELERINTLATLKQSTTSSQTNSTVE